MFQKSSKILDLQAPTLAGRPGANQGARIPSFTTPQQQTMYLVYNKQLKDCTLTLLLKGPRYERPIK